MAWIKKHGVTLALIIVMIIGIGLLAYPSVSNYWNKLHQSRAILNYIDDVSDIDNEDYDKMLEQAREYNEKLAQTGVVWDMTDEQKREYESCLDITGTGIMAYIDIPKIDVKLPVYHGTDDAVLQTSIGHLTGTSLPVGGESTHTVLSGHRGLPSARLFTDLDKMETGDTFFIHVLDETLTYEVDNISVIEPQDLSQLQIVQGEDLCTLVTCTPYGINTHRLLVRGHRIDTPSDVRVTADAIREDITVALIIAAAVAAGIISLIVFAVRRHRKKKIHGDRPL